MNRPQARLSHAVLALACALPAALFAQGTMEIVPLKHRSVEQVIPVLRPLVEPGGVVSGQGYQLILRASPRNLADLKNALAAIDTPQRRLVISVRFDDQAESARSGVEARGTLRSGDLSVSSQRFPAERSQAEVRIDSSRQASMSGSTSAYRYSRAGAPSSPRVSRVPSRNGRSSARPRAER
ncbi:MAG: hypothetical protein IPK29_07325 [Betaproteobacteria bacterium]|nr:hypothetical protein [Betaproteobacteria bacterium]